MKMRFRLCKKDTFFLLFLPKFTIVLRLLIDQLSKSRLAFFIMGTVTRADLTDPFIGILDFLSKRSSDLVEAVLEEICVCLELVRK